MDTDVAKVTCINQVQNTPTIRVWLEYTSPTDGSTVQINASCTADFAYGQSQTIELNLLGDIESIPTGVPIFPHVQSLGGASVLATQWVTYAPGAQGNALYEVAGPNASQYYVAKLGVE